MNTVVIPSHSILTLPVKIPSVEHISDIAIVEPTNHIYTEKNISVVRGIIHARDETKMIQIVNNSNSDIKLYPNTLLGTCESAFTNPEPHHARNAAIKMDPYSESNMPLVSTNLPDYLHDLWSRSSKNLNVVERGLQRRIFKIPR